VQIRDGRAAAFTADRLGLVEYDYANAPKYLPYGDEPSTTEQNRLKFATYFRDGSTALDYAQQRYYASTLGRFTTTDPYDGSADGKDPQSWNRYSYVQNDPVNHNDPSAMNMAFWDDWGVGGVPGVSWDLDPWAMRDPFEFLSSSTLGLGAPSNAGFFTASQTSASIIYGNGDSDNFSFKPRPLSDLSIIQAILAASMYEPPSTPAQPPPSVISTAISTVLRAPTTISATFPVYNPPIFGINVSVTLFPGTSQKPCAGVGLALGFPAAGWSVGPLLIGTDRRGVTAQRDVGRTRHAIEGLGWSAAGIENVIGLQGVGSSSGTEAGPIVGSRGPTVSTGYSHCF
jgi:RHS repeat-associated protein